jgi:hypothetical protein
MEAGAREHHFAVSASKFLYMLRATSTVAESA